MRKIIISSNDSQKRLDCFLQKFLYNVPSSLIHKYIRKKRIKINGKKSDCSYRLQLGDTVELYINDEFFENSSDKYEFKKSNFELDIVYEDENIILVNKPSGLIVHPDKENNYDCLINRIQYYLYNKKEYIPENENSFTPSLVNRLDRNTSGIVIAAKNSSSLSILNKKMKDREIKKTYLCLVYGKMKKKCDILKGYLDKNASENKVYIKENRESKTSKTILTKYRVVEERENFSLLEIELLTGRTHQIRAHLAHIGHPIIGDGKYGKNSINKNFTYKHQALCAYKLEFDFKSATNNLDYLNKKIFTIDILRKDLLYMFPGSK